MNDRHWQKIATLAVIVAITGVLVAVASRATTPHDVFKKLESIQAEVEARPKPGDVLKELQAFRAEMRDLLKSKE